MPDLIDVLGRWARRHPGSEEGVACAGTALERRTIKARGKAFVFLGKGEMRLKLADALAEARGMAAREPRRYEVGANGWIKVTFDGDVPLEVMKRWIDESHQVLCGAAKAAPKKKAAKKKVAPTKAAAKKKAAKK